MWATVVTRLATSRCCGRSGTADTAIRFDFTAKLIALRRDHPNLHCRRFFQDRQIRISGETRTIHDICWLNTDGQELDDAHWNMEWNRAIGVMLNGQTLRISDDDGHPIRDNSFLLFINASADGVEFTLPPSPDGTDWCHIIDTQNVDDPFAEVTVGDKIIIGGRSLVLFKDRHPKDREQRKEIRS